MKRLLRRIPPAGLLLIAGLSGAPMTAWSQSFSGDVMTGRNYAWIGFRGPGRFLTGGFDWGDPASNLMIGLQGGSGFVEVGSGSITAATVHVSSESSTGVLKVTRGTATIGSLTIHSGGTMLIEPDAFVRADSLEMKDRAGEPAATLTHQGVLEVKSLSRATFGSSSQVVIDGGTLRFNAATGISGFLAGDVTLADGGGRFDTQDFTVPIHVPLGGAGTLTKTGGGTLTFTTSQGYTGATHVDGGTLKVQSGTFASASVVLAEGTTFEVENLPTYSGVISGEGRFVKSGPGTTTLTGASTYTGTTTVTDGALVVDGSIAGSVLTTARDGGTLSGSGAVGALAIDAGGILSPGHSPGTLAAGDTTWLGGGTYVWEINDATGTAGANWNLLNVSGTLTLSGTEADPFTIDIRSLTLDDSPGLAENFDPAQSYTWILATTTAGISGFDEDKFRIIASGFANAPDASRFSLSSTGTHLILTYSAVPEPATWGAVLGVGLLTLPALRRRHRD